MRKGTKSSLYTAFTPMNCEDVLKKKPFAVVDGGYLLHKVVWQKNASFSAISQSYCSFLTRHYGSEVAVIFDGYPAESATKSAERLRRTQIHTSPDVIFDKTTINAVAQDKFLSNANNKIRLIELLKTEFEDCGIQVNQAHEDADRLIVETAIAKAQKCDAVVLVGEDVDLLVLMTGLGQQYKNLFFLKPGRGGANDVCYSTASYKFNPQYILISHAFSGCDATSAIFGHGKVKLCSVLEKSSGEMEHALDVFLDEQSTNGKITEAGELVFKALYQQGTFSGLETLDDMRYDLFKKSVSAGKVNLARLPPTSDAAALHSLRSFYQIQVWLGATHLSPKHYGWTSSLQGLIPQHATRDPAPKSLLESVSCTCRSGCQRACSCVKAGLKCSSICKKCRGTDCDNVPLYFSDLDTDGEEEEDTFISSTMDEVYEDQPIMAPVREEPGPSKRPRRK